ncbi:hypothetical protein N9B31_01770 [Mariniblastus sp.]|nr:hypothetical protein [Mariniblastus sp.]MDB4372983.1 hypothetical protein [Mariniblastus sp.]MDC3223648.1 hypothetical protein [Mariniblastus sp.]
MNSRCADSDHNLDLSGGLEDSSAEINIEISNSISSSSKSEDTEAAHKACPHCGELILQQAKLCKHCMFFLVRS